MEDFTDVDGRRGIQHSIEKCGGQQEHCVVHNPSEHKLKDAPVRFTSMHLFMRVCEHGVEHPDPDVMTYENSKEGPYGLMDNHECDGCCK